MNTTKYPVLRQTLIVLAFLALVGFFFALNHFVIIPRQQQAYNNKVFRVLQETSTGFIKSVEGKADVFAKNKPEKNEPTSGGGSFFIKDEPKGNLLKDSLLHTFAGLDISLDINDNIKKTYTFDADTVRLVLTGAGHASRDIAKSIPIQDVLEPTIQLLHKDLFDLVMLVKRNKDTSQEGKKLRQLQDRVLYSFGSLAAGYLLPGDSLFKDLRFTQFSSITEPAIAGAQYKAFTMPFRFAGHELILVGFIKEKTYNITTTSYSKRTLLLIVFLVMIFVLSLPLIKIYLSSRQERITTNDLRGLMVTFTVMPLLIILTAVTLLTYRQTDDKTGSGLQEMHRQVQERFRSEIKLAVSQLKHYNALLKDTGKLGKHYTQNRNVLRKSMADTLDFKDVLLYPTIYKNAEDVFWVNGEGKQVAKWYFQKDREVSYFDVSGRNYFQKMRDRQGYVSGRDTFYIEPTISWSTGKYAVNILTPSDQKFLTLKNPQRQKDTTQAIMIGLGSVMYSVCNPVTPKGYNFCIINAKGEILFHSQTERSLHENLFEESNENAELISAINKKDSALLPDVQLFDRNVKMLVSPMPDMPSLSLVSYFNKREQNLFVFHVSAFTLLGTTLALFGVLLLVLLYYFFGSGSEVQRSYLYESAWMKPSEKKNDFYQQNMTQQLCVLALSLLFLALMAICGNHFWFLLQASVLLPFLVITGYILLRNEYNKKHSAALQNAQNQQKTSFLRRNRRELLIYLFSSAFVLLSLNELHNHLSGFRFVPVLLIVLLWLSVPLIARHIAFLQKIVGGMYPRRSIINYTGIIFLSTFLVSVLPAFGIFGFALNEEKKMQVKAAQFDAAEKIEARRNVLNSYFKDVKMATADTVDTTSALLIDNYVRARKFHKDKGIYLLQNKMETAAFREKDSMPVSVHSSFYQAVTQFLFLPKDHADFFDNNSSYYWQEAASDSLVLTYKNETDHQTADSIVICQTKEDSSLLSGLFNSFGGWLILLCVVAFFVFQFMLIQTITKKIFLLDHFNFTKEDLPDERWVQEFYDKRLSSDKKIQAFFKQYGGILTNKSIRAIEEKCMKKQAAKEEGVTNTESLPVTNDVREPNNEESVGITKEELILHLQYLLSPVYNTIWNRLKNNERFVLYDFALDGFTNYRNIDIIYRLYQQGLIIKAKDDKQLELMNHSFRSYLLGKAGSKEIVALERQLTTGSTWKNLRNVFFILVVAVLIFIFATQQDVSNRILVIVSGLATLVPGLLKIFDRNVGGGDGKK